MPTLLTSFNQGTYYPGLVNSSPEMQDMQIGLTHTMMQDDSPDEKYGRLSDEEKAKLITYSRRTEEVENPRKRIDKSFQVRKHGTLWETAIK